MAVLALALLVSAGCKGGGGPAAPVPLTPPERTAPERAAPRLYQQHCVTCHGPSGRGDGEALHMLTDRPMDWSRPGTLDKLSDEELARWIAQGTPGTGKRPQPMPGFRGPLSEAEIGALVIYVRALAKAPPEPRRQGR